MNQKEEPRFCGICRGIWRAQISWNKESSKHRSLDWHGEPIESHSYQGFRQSAADGCPMCELIFTNLPKPGTFKSSLYNSVSHASSSNLFDPTEVDIEKDFKTEITTYDRFGRSFAIQMRSNQSDNDLGTPVLATYEYYRQGKTAEYYTSSKLDLWSS